MRYKVYAGKVSVTIASSKKARFNWTEKTLVYDSCGDAVEGEEAEGILADPVVNLENKDPGTFTCLVPYRAETRKGPVYNPYYEKIEMGKTFILVEEDGECIFFGRVTECELEFNLDKSVMAKGVLNDLSGMQTRLPAASYPSCSTSTSSLLYKIMKPDKSTKDLSPVNCMARGNVTVKSRTVDTTEKGDQFGSWWSILSTYLLEEDEGYLRLRLACDPGTEDYFFYYDYLADADVPATNQKIEYGVNMLDFNYSEKRDSDIVNSVTAHGIETVKKGWWIFSSTSYEPITSTCSDAASVSRYGLLSKHIYVDGKKSTSDSLYTAAEEELKNYKQDAEPTLTVKAFDQRDTGKSVDKLGYLLRTRIYSKPHKMNRDMICTAVKLPLDAPDSKEFTFGATGKKASYTLGKLMNLTRNLEVAVAGLIGNANS